MVLFVFKLQPHNNCNQCVTSQLINDDQQ